MLAKLKDRGSFKTQSTLLNCKQIYSEKKLALFFKVFTGTSVSFNALGFTFLGSLRTVM